MIRRSLAIACSVAASCAILAGQGSGAPPPASPQNPQQPTFRLRVDSISVDVAVTDRQGRPVTDLKAEDFEIREAGKLQVIDSFRLVEIEDLPVGPEPTRSILSMSEMQRATADPENRLFIIFLDDFHTRSGNALHIRQSLSRFVEGLTSRDLVALLYPLNAVTGATFSRDHDGTAAGIRNFQGRKYNYAPTTPYEQQFSNLPPEVQEHIRNDLTIKTLQSACALLSTLRDGRKTLVFVSEGLAANIPVGALTMGGPLFPPRTPPTVAQTQALTSREFFNTADLMGRMRDVFSTCSRGNTAIYAVDPRGLAPSEFGSADRVGADADRLALNEAIDSLRTLADQTDGRAIIGKNDPVPDLKNMVRELSAYYLLGYTSSIAPRDGKFHEIQVRVNRRDVEVRARKGYWAYSEDEIRRASEPPKPGPPEEVAAALDTLAAVVEPASRRGVALWTGAVRGEDHRAQVTLAWEAAPGAPQEPADRVEQISITATTVDGETVFRGAVPRDQAALRPSGRVSFAAPPGPLRIRVVTENARGQRLDTEDVNEMVPDFTSTGAIVTAPEVFRGRTARDIAVLRDTPTAIPAAARLFSRTERLLLRFEAYGPAGTTPQLSLRLLNRLGEPLATLPSPAARTGAVYEAEVGLASFPPGDYLIEIAAVTGTDRSTRLIGIRVTG